MDSLADQYTIPKLCPSSLIKEIAEGTSAKYILLNVTGSAELGKYSLRRVVKAAEDTGAAMIYSDYYQVKDGVRKEHPTIEYQPGSLRDDFDFGSLILFNAAAFKEAAARMSTDYRYAGLYDLRLKISEQGKILRLPEYLYAQADTDERLSGEKQFDYVDPKNREVQIEMESACTGHLKSVGGWLPPAFKTAALSAGLFPVEASVIIPVRNRAKTIGDAVRSVLEQKTDEPFNLIVVDNHSTDGTTGILQEFAARDKRVVHITPQSDNLGIGGCWNEAVTSGCCGRFAIQLDSDDLYIDDNVIQTIVDKFHKESCAMIIGSYRMVDFDLKTLPPGVIDHKEWSDDNGPNNALRINGLGAPRAFFTPVLRDILFPDTSYGEDYAVALAVSRSYRIGRIYEPLYLCRRWEGNSDAALDVTKVNTNNYYKDTLRTMELAARQKMMKDGKQY